MSSEAAKPQTIARRIQHGYLPLEGFGIDVGAGPDPSYWAWWSQFRMTSVRPWDRADGDAHALPGVESNSLDWIFASHILEHLANPTLALTRWIDVVRPGGKLLLSVPHRDLYEGRTALPSHWNHEHVRFYVPGHDEPPDTVGFWPWLRAAAGGQARIALFGVGDRDCVPTSVPNRHATGEYCIDALLVKR